MEETKNSNYQISLPLILCIGLAAGVLIGASLTSKSNSGDVGEEVQKMRDFALRYCTLAEAEQLTTDQRSDA